MCVCVCVCTITYDGLKITESITKKRIKEDNVGHGKDLHFLLIALTMM